MRRAAIIVLAALGLGGCGIGAIYADVSSSDTLGGDVACAIDIDERVICWGVTTAPDLLSPPDDPMLQVSVGFAHACGLRTDGTITCWGAGTEESVCETNNCGQALPPDGVFTSVSAGRRHTCAVASDETVQCWGVDAQRQASPPAGAFVKVAAGDVLTCGIRVGGQVVCWGNSADPEDIDGEYQDVSVAIGSACGITTDGLLQCWGTNPFDAPSGTFTQVSIGLVHGCAVRTDRSLECFTNGALYPDATPLPGPFRQVAVGMGGLGIDTNGVLHCWGVAPNVCREFPH